MKKLLKMLRILPVYILLKKHKREILELRKQTAFMERWVAVSDFSHAITQEKLAIAETELARAKARIESYVNIVVKQHTRGN